MNTGLLQRGGPSVKGRALAKTTRSILCRCQRQRRDVSSGQGCQIGPDFTPNLATLVAARIPLVCQIGREIRPNLATQQVASAGSDLMGPPGRARVHAEAR